MKDITTLVTKWYAAQINISLQRHYNLSYKIV